MKRIFEADIPWIPSEKLLFGPTQEEIREKRVKFCKITVDIFTKITYYIR